MLLQLQSLLSNVAFGYGCGRLAQYEQSAIGVSWDNIMDSGTFDNNCIISIVSKTNIQIREHCPIEHVD